MNPKYPIYIVSKGRWKTRMTSKALEKMNVPYRIVVEDAEYDDYASVIDHNKILVLNKKYQDMYDTFDDILDSKKSKGPGPARNYCWDHSIQNGYEYHWVMDDNISAFGRINNNLYVHVTSGTIFKCIEDFIARYDNLYMAGLNYDFLAKAKTIIPPYVLNTRIYSCIARIILNVIKIYEPETYKLLSQEKNINKSISASGDWYDNSIEVYFKVSLPYPYEPCYEVRKILYDMGYHTVFWNFEKDIIETVNDRTFGREPYLTKSCDEIRGFEPRHVKWGKWKLTKYGFVDDRFNEEHFRENYNFSNK